jgi:phosphate starvation-inducible protein PhoH and related proteins
MAEATVSVGDARQMLTLFGARDQNLRGIQDTLAVDVFARDGEIHIIGDDKQVAQATAVFEELRTLVSRYGNLPTSEVSRVLARVTGTEEVLDQPVIDVYDATRKIRPKTAGQARYVVAIDRNDLVFCVGPAGTGKTYLAVAMAVTYLRQKRIRKIVLVRPAVEAGESLGFLPGDLQAKINPYQRPLLDALREMMDYEQFRRFMEQDVIEVIPLAYMRGRTLNDAFIILDEAQNTTISQMKMFLTRMGHGSKIVVSGDTTQVDLPPHQRNGLTDALERLRAIESFCAVELSEADIVRHRLVQAIVRAYEQPQDPGAARGTPRKGRRGGK